MNSIYMDEKQLRALEPDLLHAAAAAAAAAGGGNLAQVEQQLSIVAEGFVVCVNVVLLVCWAARRFSSTATVCDRPARSGSGS
jgi:hypothetical protein